MAERGCLSINFDLSALLFLPDPDPKQMIPNQDPGKSSGPDRIRIQNTGFDQVGNTSFPKNTEVKQLGPQLAIIRGLNVQIVDTVAANTVKYQERRNRAFNICIWSNNNNKKVSKRF